MFNVKVEGIATNLDSERLKILRIRLRSTVQLVIPGATDICVSIEGHDPEPPEIDMTISFSSVPNIIEKHLELL